MLLYMLTDILACACMCCVFVHLQEMLRCDGVTIDVNPQDRLPTVSADQSDNITIKYHLPQAVSDTPTLLAQSWKAEATWLLEVVQMCAWCA